MPWLLSPSLFYDNSSQLLTRGVLSLMYIRVDILWCQLSCPSPCSALFLIDNLVIITCTVLYTYHLLTESRNLHIILFHFIELGNGGANNGPHQLHMLNIDRLGCDLLLCTMKLVLGQSLTHTKTCLLIP